MSKFCKLFECPENPVLGCMLRGPCDECRKIRRAVLEWVLGGTDLNWIDTNTVRAGITKELEKLNE